MLYSSEGKSDSLNIRFFQRGLAVTSHQQYSLTVPVDGLILACM